MSTGTTLSTALTTNQREELLRRSWMATDGLWYHRTAETLGVDGANDANIRVVREFGRQEMVRLMNSLGVVEVETVEQYRQLFTAAVELYLGSLFVAEESFAEDTHTIDVTTCFAHKGVKRAGIDMEYHCGPGERLTGWLQAMEIPAEIDPGVGLCQMAHTGSCAYKLKIGLPRK